MVCVQKDSSIGQFANEDAIQQIIFLESSFESCDWLPQPAILVAKCKSGLVLQVTISELTLDSKD